MNIPKIIVCKNCKNRMLADVKYCNNCGMKMGEDEFSPDGAEKDVQEIYGPPSVMMAKKQRQPEDKADVWTCKCCGAVMSDGEKYCNSCGEAKGTENYSVATDMKLMTLLYGPPSVFGLSDDD